MKRRIAMLLICSLLLALLSGCGNTNPTGQGASSDGVDYNQYLNAQGAYGCTDMGWYIYENNQIEFLDAGLKTPILPLCAKADCPHNDPTTCSSYLPEGSFCVYAWNNLLYFEKFDTDSSSEDLYQMGLDGQDRKKIITMVPDTDSFAGVMQCGGGHFSLVYYEYTVNGDVSILYLFSLEDPNAQPEILFTNEEQVMEAQGDTSQVPRPYVVHMGEDWIFYSVEVGPHGNVTTSLYGYQIATGETKLLVEDDFFVGGDLSPVGDTLYWYDTDGSTFGALNSIDLNTGEISEICEIPVEDNWWGSMDDQFLYVSGCDAAGNAALAVYDFEGNLLQELSGEELDGRVSYAFSNGDKAFFRLSAQYSNEPVCWVDKKAVAKGKAEFQMLEFDN